MSSGHCCMYFCFVTFGVYIDIEKKNPTIAVNLFYVKKSISSYLILKHILNHEKQFSDSKHRRISLSCSTKTISIIMRNNFNNLNNCGHVLNCWF